MIVWFIYILSFKVHTVLTDEKRLLLNDPDVLVNRLNRLESIISVLNSTVQQQSLTIQQEQTTIHQHERTIKKLEDTINNSQRLGTTYIRWGRKQCPDNSTELVYSGYAGGGYFGETGSAAEYVCLPPDPNYMKTSGSDAGHMYGAEFYSNFFASNSDAEDVPCSLCRTNHATSVIMVPGKNSCYSGWKLEYHGYLASGDHSHKVASAYVCVDINPEYIIGGVDRHYGKLFYGVNSKCGSLKCPPYINNYPLTCVVCSK